MRPERNDLDSIVLECRRLPVKEYISKAENSKLQYYVNPLFTILLMLVVYCIIAKIAHVTGPVMNSPLSFSALWGFLAFGYGLGIWWFNIRPQRDFLILSEKGIRWKLHLGKWIVWPDYGNVKYEDIESISFRSDYLDNDAKVSGKEGDDIAQLIVDIFFPKGALLIVLKNGESREIENILNRFDPKDIEKFLEYLVKNHSRIIRVN